MKTNLANTTLAELLDRHTVTGAAELCRTEGDRIRCLACGHRCLIGEGQRGICKVRFNDGGRLQVPFGYVAGLQCDPVEKKPFFHVYPGSDALTFGMMGCDLHCAYCQNWLTSQALRDAKAVAPVRALAPADLVDLAGREGARLLVSSYNEPLITSEWAVAVFRAAAAAGLDCAFVSNGNATPEVLDFLRPWIVAYKIDLKSFNDRNYRKLGGTLENITRTVQMVHERGLWLEVVTLIVPGFNDSAEELRQIARFLVSVSPDIPWHVTAFHQDYRMTDPDPTPAHTLVGAAEIGAEEGLRFIYAGNLPGRVGPWEDTRCPSCRSTLIERYGYLVRSYRLTREGRCPNCQAPVPGIWPGAAAEVKTGNDRLAYQSRLPRPVRIDPIASRPENRAPGYDRQRPPVQGQRAALPLVHAPQTSGGTQVMSAEESIGTVPRVTAPEELNLTADQKKQVVEATAAMVCAVVTGEQAVFPAGLAELRNQLVSGAFVSLKRGRHLRSCCGLIGRPIPLSQAVEHAADRTVWEDERFPPIAPAELQHLEMEVWLLYNLQRVQAAGEDRLQAIAIGKHGIKVMRRESGGLFLPSVAVENQWDAQRFLDKVCMKAGLPSTAWKDDSTALYTFEGEVIRSPLAGLEAARSAQRLPGPPCNAEDLAALVALCRDNLAALLMGAVPRHFAGAVDGMVNGIVLLLQPTSEIRYFTRFSLRPGMPLQANLFSLLQVAAQYLAKLGATADAVAVLPVGLLILHDPMLHGTVADPHLTGFDPKSRGFFVLERNKAGLVFDPAETPEKLLAEVAHQARVTQAGTAVVFSLGAVTNASRVSVSTVPTPVRGPAVRPAAVAGKFYAADPEELSRTVDRLLAGQRCPEDWQAALVPHAGLTYSGQIAADVLKCIRIPRTVIVIGPKHTGLGMDWAVAPHQQWGLPGGGMASNFMLARRLSQAIAGLEMDAAAHEREHAIEVELPLLARLAPETEVVGIAIGHGDLESCRRFAEGLAEVLKGCPERPLLLISSDMNHFATDTETRRLDALALAALDQCDAAQLYERVTRHSISMCGVLPAVIVLETLRLLGSQNRAKQVGYATSADVTGDTSRVVGYAGMLFG